jgi:serine/threonine-protein kinase
MDMTEIPLYNTFTKIEPIHKGMSGDKKYYIETVNGKHLLLRVADITEYNQKKLELEVMKNMATLNIPMSLPVDFGVCDGGGSVYTLLSWIDGVEVEYILPALPEAEQYALGAKSGEILRRIHSSSASKGVDDWPTRYFSVIDQRLEAFRNEGVSFEGDDIIINYLETNKHLLKNRPQCYQHGDYHMGNIIQSNDGNLFVIDWQIVDYENYGDPWYEFNRIGIEFPAFASGQIDGYFNNKPPETFWRLLAYYLSASAITSIVWAKYFAPERLHSILDLNKDILYWFNDMKNLVPTWYLKDFYKNS